jgi:hypothetical protein
VVAFYGFASAVYLETMSHLPADKKRVQRLKEIFEEDSAKSMALIFLFFVFFLFLEGNFRYGCVSCGTSVGVFKEWMFTRR